MSNNYYVDTRDNLEAPVSFTEAVVAGLAPGGGLFVPQTIPSFTLEEICAMAELPYAQRAATVFNAFDPDLSEETIKAVTKRAYGENFDNVDICPITALDSNIYMLELWHGPTSAFKDMALQCLPLLFSESAKELHQRGTLDTTTMILVATSGDTGKAALEGFCNVDGVSIGVLYPEGGVSDIQYKQMATQRGENVRVWAVRGNFDDCQTGAKTVFGDEDFAKKLKDEKKITLSSANSINWGRLLPQIVYYISAYGQMVKDGAIQAGDPIDVCVPTGNFGNILAAYYAKQMGTPIRRLLCASNENRVLTDFINTGTYDISDREFIKTPSPSMDILVSSNLERQLFELTGRDGAAIKQWMTDLKQNQKFQVDRDTFAKMRELYSADSVTNEESLDTIREVFASQNYLMDPHTAVAYRVAENLRENDVPVLVASTAHWAKFGSNVYRALNNMTCADNLPDSVSSLTDCELNKAIAAEANNAPIPAGLSELDSMPIRFTQVIDANKDAIEEAVIEFLDSAQ